MTTRAEVEQAISAMEVAALNFAYRLTKDAATRQWYIHKTQAMSRELQTQYAAGGITARKAAETANQMRNEIMEMARVRSSDMGRAAAQALKTKGKTLEELIRHYSNRKFGKVFESLTQGQQDEVLVEIVEASGRANPKVNARVGKMAAVGRILWVISAVIAVYNISIAEDKAHATGREVANLGGGFAGGAAGGALAGIWFGPLGVAVGAAVGGLVGYMIADEAYSELTPPSDPGVANLLPRFTGFWSFDEEGLAKALYDECGIDTERVLGVFRELHHDHGGDADAAAMAYLSELERRGGPPLHALKLNGQLRAMLARSLRSGWWTTDAEARAARRVLAM